MAIKSGVGVVAGDARVRLGEAVERLGERPSCAEIRSGPPEIYASGYFPLFALSGLLLRFSKRDTDKVALNGELLFWNAPSCFFLLSLLCPIEGGVYYA